MNSVEERILEKLDAMHTEQVRQGVILEQHEQRSTQLETRVAPLEAHVQRWAGIGKAVTVLGTLASIAAAVWKVLG
jgi:hypothetical protein